MQLRAARIRISDPYNKYLIGEPNEATEKCYKLLIDYHQSTYLREREAFEVFDFGG